ncbi:MAG: hypothetical protein ACR2N3_19205 [Pyrinomonadaceae bacterium]
MLAGGEAGAGIGTFIEPGGGTIIGAVAGGLIGGIAGATAGYMSCNHDRDGCIEAAIDKCPACSK